MGMIMCEFRGLNNSANKAVLTTLEPIYLKVWRTLVHKVTIVELEVNSGGGS